MHLQWCRAYLESAARRGAAASCCSRRAATIRRVRNNALLRSQRLSGGAGIRRSRRPRIRPYPQSQAQRGLGMRLPCRRRGIPVEHARRAQHPRGLPCARVFCGRGGSETHDPTGRSYRIRAYAGRLAPRADARLSRVGGGASGLVDAKVRSHRQRAVSPRRTDIAATAAASPPAGADAPPPPLPPAAWCPLPLSLTPDPAGGGPAASDACPAAPCPGAPAAAVAATGPAGPAAAAPPLPPPLPLPLPPPAPLLAAAAAAARPSTTPLYSLCSMRMVPEPASSTASPFIMRFRQLCCKAQHRESKRKHSV